MRSIVFAGAGAIATFTVGGFASPTSMAVMEGLYEKDKCEDADLKDEDTVVMEGECRKCTTTDCKPHYYKYSCTDSIPKKEVYTDSKCETADTTKDVVYKEDDKVCEQFETGETTLADRWIKRTCVSGSELAYFAYYNKAGCAKDSLFKEGFGLATTCSKAATVEGTVWKAGSIKRTAAADGQSVTLTDYNSMDCSGDADGEARSSPCGGRCTKDDGQEQWYVSTSPLCGKAALISGAVASAPTLMLKALALTLAKIVL